MTRYYYAGGRRISLEPDPELVAIDERRAEGAGVRAESADASTRRLPGGVMVTPRAGLDATHLDALRAAGALRPVYRHDKALMVALPEVRVEVDTARQRADVLRALDCAPHEVIVASDSDGAIVLAPRSGSSDDAIDVANHVYESAHPAAASVRFVQFVPRPGVTRK